MNDEKTETDPLLDTDYVAWHIIGCTANWLERLRCQGRGPEFIKVGRLAIDAWLAENTFPRKQIPKRKTRAETAPGGTSPPCNLPSREVA